MLIGVIADTHDNLDNIGKAVRLFNGRGVSLVIHAGDLVSPAALEAFGGLEAEFTAVLGNNDEALVDGADRPARGLHRQPHTIRWQGVRIIVTHEPRFLAGTPGLEAVDLVIYGHTHRPEVRREGRVLVVNPGWAGHRREGRATVALVTMPPLDAEIIAL